MRLNIKVSDTDPYSDRWGGRLQIGGETTTIVNAGKVTETRFPVGDSSSPDGQLTDCVAAENRPKNAVSPWRQPSKLNFCKVNNRIPCRLMCRAPSTSLVDSVHTSAPFSSCGDKASFKSGALGEAPPARADTGSNSESLSPFSDFYI